MSKLLAMSEAISRFVSDGSSVALGLALEGLIPFAAGHEIIRQGVRDLTLIGPISDILFDQIIGAGCVSKVIAAWVGNVITGSGYNFRRAVEEGQIEVEDHSNLSVTMALLAGSLVTISASLTIQPRPKQPWVSGSGWRAGCWACRDSRPSASKKE